MSSAFEKVRSLRARPVAGIALFLAAACACAFADEPLPAAPIEGQLAYRAAGFNLCLTINLQRAEVNFRKEPAYAGTHIMRGAIPLSADSKQFIGFALDAGSGTLYVDANSNLDLTDDPNGIYKANFPGAARFFEGVTIEPSNGDLKRKYVGTLYCYEDRFCQFTVQSGWVGTITANGAAYQIGIADNLDGKLDSSDTVWIRPAPGASDSAPTTGRSVRAADGDYSESAALPAYVCLKDRAFTLQAAFGTDDGQTTIRIALGGPTVSQSELRVVGDGIAAVALNGNPSVLLVDPAGSVRMPEGSYSIRTIVLRDKATCRAGYSGATNVSVIKGEPSELKAGGPLRQYIGTMRSGSTLQLSYRLEDAAGREYTVPVSNAPRFKVLKGDRVVASGQFEYG